MIKLFKMEVGKSAALSITRCAVLALGIVYVYLPLPSIGKSTKTIDPEGGVTNLKRYKKEVESDSLPLAEARAIGTAGVAGLNMEEYSNFRSATAAREAREQVEKTVKQLDQKFGQVRAEVQSRSPGASR